MVPLLIAGGVVFILVVWFISTQNKLVRRKNNRENAFADIDVQLKQRHDLIPQLVSTVKGYADHEKDLLVKVTEARRQAIAATGINDKIAAEQTLTATLAGFNLQMEAYPDLKANSNFMQLQEELSDIENKLAAVRRYFNSATRELNNAVEMFPSSLVAGMLGYKEQPYFDLGTDQRAAMDKAPEIKF